MPAGAGPQRSQLAAATPPIPVMGTPPTRVMATPTTMMSPFQVMLMPLLVLVLGLVNLLQPLEVQQPERPLLQQKQA